jgi:predicted nucleotidyltransferase
MTRTSELQPEELAILRAVLAIYLPSKTAIWVFGSRATGGARRYSDIDLAFEGIEPLDVDMLGALREALSESDLTIKADVVDLRAADPAFRRIIEDQLVPFRLNG